MNFKQRIFDLLLTTPATGIGNKILVKLLRVLEKAILRSGAPLVQYSLRGVTIRLPWTHNLPAVLQLHPQYSDNIARIGRSVKKKYDETTMIDIGANIGDTAILQRARAHYPILCIEGDDRFYSLLCENVSSLPEVYTAKHFVNISDGETRALWKQYLGSGTLDMGSEGNRTIRFSSLANIVSEFPQFSDSKLLKIDTDGFDLKILRGAGSFLKQAQPVLLFEYDPYFLELQHDDGLSIFPFLKDCGYRHIMVYDNLGDYLLSTEVGNKNLLGELHSYYSGRGGGSYCDLCVFHENDEDLFQTILGEERNYFKALRKY